MNPERWQRIKRLLEAALDQPPSERTSFLDQACGSDPELRKEVESLINYRDEAESFLVNPADKIDGVEDPEAGPTREFPSRSLSPGQILGNRFQIRSLLGRGGIGEVWQAYDLKLRIDVALKTLRAELLEKERALQSLRREVRSAREVVSPNVCRVFDLLELDGHELVSMEYIDGTTLVNVLDSRGPLEIQEAREIASQFLAGLEAIHQAGLVHRDLKPENVMITRSGRVIVMDFGIAKGLADKKTGTVSGTPAYMAPEQARGEKVDARADVFSAGVVLAEMIAPQGIPNHTAREAIWQGIHRELPELPETPWVSVLKKAVARVAADRYASAAALARALEEVTLQVEGAEDVRPYPGLASFTEDDAEYFFGRELEVEAMWKKLRRPHLLGLIGPSGAGKSSFLRAGLLPVIPEGWRAVICHPGTAPFQNLARALVSEFVGDSEAIQELLSIENLDSALLTFKRWRQKHTEVLVIVDPFEELFALNPPEVQSRFAELLGAMSVESDVRVLLSMRDDFFVHCHEYSSLAPIFSEPTPLHAPTGTALRRALVQPALKCGYRFEDESLVEEMITEVSEERGALPLLAFAAAQLWEKRDRKQGLLTREAYQAIGGVGGALAQHAEATLEKIGSDRLTIVRELFRNLVTAQGTRIARDMKELLSVFEDQDAAKDVLRVLIDARLLTSFEMTAGDEEEKGRHLVEIIHESLLTAWPRLVRWRTQDQEGAQLRDELRQAAQLWEQHGRSTDRLWTGTAVKEFQLWRERYSGALTTTEEFFAQAMARHAERRRRRRRLAVSAVIILLLGGMSVIAAFWHRSEKARKEAFREAERREAAQLLALARLEIDDHPTAALAYTLASLERADSTEARRFAVETLWRGPPAFILTGADNNKLDFSPDGRWLAAGGAQKGVQLWSREGGPPQPLVASQSWPPTLAFGPNSDTLFVASELTGNSGKSISFVSVPDGTVSRRLDFDRTTSFFRKAGTLITGTEVEKKTRLFQSWPLPSGEAKTIGLVDIEKMDTLTTNGTLLGYARKGKVFVRALENFNAGGGRLIGEHEVDVLTVTFEPGGRWLAAADESGEICFWPLTGESRQPTRRFHGLERAGHIHLDPTGRWMASGHGRFLPTSATSWLWDLEGAPDADPLPLRISQATFQAATLFHPNGQWLAVANTDLGTTLWPLSGKYPRFLRGHSSFTTVTFTPDGQSLVSTSSDGTVRLWPLTAVSGERSRILLEDDTADCMALAVDTRGRNLLTNSRFDGRVFLIPLHGGSPRVISTVNGIVNAVALSDDGRLAAAAIITRGFQSAEIRIWELESGEVQVLNCLSETADASWTTIQRGGVYYLRFMPDGRLFSAGGSGFRLWDLSTGTSEVLRESSTGYSGASTSPDGRFAVFHDADPTEETAVLSIYDMVEKRSWNLEEHGNRVAWWASAFDPSGTLVVTGDSDGVVRVGPVTGETPNLLFGHRRAVKSVAVSPDGRWIASSDDVGEIRLWPMPVGTPLHTLPYEDLLERLRSLTNLRVVPDEEASSDYRFDYAPFPGWEKVPTW